MLGQVSSLMILLIAASFIHHLGKQLKIPYTILLFISGLGLSYISTFVPALAFLTQRSLTPELLFYIFLPVLLFEAGYNISYEKLSKNYILIWGLAIIGVLLSSAIIGFGGRYILQFLGWDIPLIAMILFGIIISSTDPVAVLSIFKHFGVPKRLYLIFEGESLFNDGTSVALFLITLGIIQQGGFSTSILPEAIFRFIIMIGGGIVLGIAIGIGFAELIKYIKYNTESEIALTMILPHTTFLLSEHISQVLHIGTFPLHISGVIATAYTAIIMGNYGRTKITPKVEKYMDKFWSFFTFVCNSLVFLLMGIMMRDINAPVAELAVPIGIAIVLVLVARAISIYLPSAVYNRSGVETTLPRNYQHLLVRGSLRGALGLMLALMIPLDLTLPGWEYSFSVRDFILLLTISTILFSLIIQGLSIKKLLKIMNLDQLYDLEKFEKYEAEIYIFNKIIKHIKETMQDDKICKETYNELINKYSKKLLVSQKLMSDFLEIQENKDELLHKALSLHALGIEKQYLLEMYTYNEIPEHLYHYLEQKIEKQQGRITRNEPQITGKNKKKMRKSLKKRMPFMCKDPIKLLTGWLQYAKHDEHDTYIINRTKSLISKQVLDGLTSFQTIPFGYDVSKQMKDIISLYETFHTKAQEEISDMKIQHPKLMQDINSVLLNKGVMKHEEHMVHELFDKDFITGKIYKQFMHEIEEEVLKTY